MMIVKWVKSSSPTTLLLVISSQCGRLLNHLTPVEEGDGNVAALGNEVDRMAHGRLRRDLLREKREAATHG
jgi:hypothetical protein